MHPALDIDLFATSAVPHAAETVTEPSRDQVPEMAPVAGQFQSSPAPDRTFNSAIGSQNVAYGAGEAFRPPPGYVLVERDVVEKMFAMIQAPNPSWDYLAIGRGAA